MTNLGADDFISLQVSVNPAMLPDTARFPCPTSQLAPQSDACDYSLIGLQTFTGNPTVVSRALEGGAAVTLCVCCFVSSGSVRQSVQLDRQTVPGKLGMAGPIRGCGAFGNVCGCGPSGGLNVETWNLVE